MGHFFNLAAESMLIRAISRAVDDAVIVAGGKKLDGISEMALEVIADYSDPSPWETGAGTFSAISFLWVFF